MKKFLITLFLTFIATGSLHAQTATPEVSASVDKTTITEGNNIELKITYKNIDAQQLDIAPLKQNFDILQAGNYSQIQMINNDYSKTVTEYYRLRPKTSGKFIIPAFKINDNIQTMPITINVLPAGSAIPNNSQTEAEKNNQFSLNGRINNNHPYVQQEIIYTLSLIDSGGLQGQEPVFELENSKDWVIRSLGTPEIIPLQVKGKNMREIIFRYAFFPQRSGNLTIPSARFEGYTLGKIKKHIDPFKDIFGDDLGATIGFTFAEREPVILRSKPIEINVQSIPLSNNGQWWLPAKNVILVNKWEPESPIFKVGEAVHRTIYLKADGVLDSQLPDLQFAEINGIKQYPEKPATEMNVERGSVVSVAKVSNVYIPNKTGKNTIPPIEIKWFDVDNGKEQTAILPSQEIEVFPNPDLKTEPETTKSDVTQIHTDEKPQEKQNIPNTQIIENTDTLNNIDIILLLVTAFGLGIFISYFIFHRKFNDKNQVTITNYKKYIIQKAKEKDLRSLRNAIPEWCAEKFEENNIHGFTEVNKLVKDKDFATELDKLTAELYSGNEGNWNAESFIMAFEKVDKKIHKKKTNKKLLPDLYKK